MVPIQNQHPMQMAQRALTLNQIAGGRFILGIGMSHRVVTEGMWGISWDKPVRQMREYLDGLLPLLAGQPADAVGEICDDARVADDPRRADARRVHRRAGPADAEAGGQAHRGHADVDDRAEDAGRTRRADAARGGGGGRPPGGRPCASPRRFRSRVTDDVDGARKQAAEQFEMYGILPSYRAMLDREGYAGPEDAAIIGDEATVTDRARRTARGGGRRVRRRHLRRLTRESCPHPRAAPPARRVSLSRPEVPAARRMPQRPQVRQA